MSLRILDWDGDFSDSRLGEAAVTIGVFDGVHLGHQELIGRIVRKGPNPTVVTFYENPKKMLGPQLFEGDIYSLRQKLAIFEGLGVSQVILIDFSANFSKLSGREFLKRLEDRVKIIFLAVGSNFRCGYRQDTGANRIKEENERRGIPTEVLDPVEISVLPGAGPVNSSRIRASILSGDVGQAAILMGRNVELDLEDIGSLDCKPAGMGPGDCCFEYNPGAHDRVIPAVGQYRVLVQPGRRDGKLLAGDGKVFLYGEKRFFGEGYSPVKSVEFL